MSPCRGGSKKPHALRKQDHVLRMMLNRCELCCERWYNQTNVHGMDSLLIGKISLLKLNAKNSPGAHSYCDCQLLKISQIKKFNTMKNLLWELFLTWKFHDLEHSYMHEAARQIKRRLAHSLYSAKLRHMQIVQHTIQHTFEHLFHFEYSSLRFAQRVAITWNMLELPAILSTSNLDTHTYMHA